MTKREKLLEQIDFYTKEDCMVAFSGGVDSSLLLKLLCIFAKEHHTTVYAMTAHTELHPLGDLEIAARVAKECGAVHEVVALDELVEAGIEFNPKNRCYLCKKCIFSKLKKAAEEKNIRYILEGTNEDDLHVYRPGLQALKELEILSPLAECGLTKQEVRELAMEYGITVASRPSAPCMATRFPYGTKLDRVTMGKVEQAETYLKTFGFYNVRLRVHGECARIEVDEKDLMKLMEHRGEIAASLKMFGFVHVTADLEGFHSGSMDEE